MSRKADFDYGCCPPDERECAQVGDIDYYEAARAQCQRYIELIRKLIGPEPKGCKLKIKSNPHDFGSYLSVICLVDDDENEECMSYALYVDNNLPGEWDWTDKDVDPWTPDYKTRRTPVTPSPPRDIDTSYSDEE